MRLSTRNQLPGVVTEANVGGVMATVGVRLDGDKQIHHGVHHHGGAAVDSAGHP